MSTTKSTTIRVRRDVLRILQAARLPEETMSMLLEDMMMYYIRFGANDRRIRQIEDRLPELWSRARPD